MNRRRLLEKARGFLLDLPLRLALLAYTVMVVYPVAWSVYSSFKTNREFFGNPYALPQRLDFTNYARALVKSKMASYFVNSIVVTALTLLVSTVLCVAAAYVLARFVNRFIILLKSVYISSLFIPIIFAIIPLFIFMSRLGLLNTRLSLSIIYTAMAFPFTIYVLTGFFKSVPKEYEEAATIDGCSHYGILFRIMSPMIRPAIVTVVLFNFIWIWNEYVIALTFVLRDDKRTIPVGLANLMEVQRYATDWGALFAGLVIVMIPSLVFYLIFQRRIIEGINIGGIKG